MKAYNIPAKYMRGILGKKFAASKNKKVNETTIPYISVMRTSEKVILILDGPFLSLMSVLHVTQIPQLYFVR